jgi:translocation and assembly module TamA
LLRGWTARVGRTQDTPRIERLYYAELTHSRVDSAALVSQGDAVSGNYQWIYRDIDNVLLPTRGFTTSAQAAVGYARGSQTVTGQAPEDARGPFSRLYARITWYKPFGDSWYGTARVEAGEVFTHDQIGVPDTVLFRAGGDDSVRGYGYRTLGPTVAGVTVSGRTLLTGSVEVARPISPKYPAYWWAAFVDAGNAADRWSNLHPVLGYGLGLRWRSPVGPLKLDVAYGQDVKQVRVHFSVGIAF